MTYLDGRVALVTGGATLIGQGVARSLRDHGATVVIGDIDTEGGQSAAEAIGGRVSFVWLDITDDGAIEEVISGIVKSHGSLDIVVNLACSYLDNGGETTREDWLSAFDVNVVGAVVVTHAARPHLAASGHGAVVNFTSISSSVAQTGRWVYPACKAAMVQLTRSMAMDMAADGVRVNSVSPGWTWSAIMDGLSGGDRAKTDRVAAPFHLTKRVGDPGEIGEVVAFLASGAASLVTGADWAVDGGYSAMGPEQAVPAIPQLEA